MMPTGEPQLRIFVDELNSLAYCERRSNRAKATMERLLAIGGHCPLLLRSPMGFVRVRLYAVDCTGVGEPSFVKFEYLFGNQIERSR